MKTFQFNKPVRDKIPAKIQKDGIGNFQVSVLATIVNDQNQVLMAKRSPRVAHNAGKWECISGRINVGELPIEALKREIAEEAGSDFRIKIIEPYYTFRLVRDDGFHVIGISFYCRYRGGGIELNDENEEYRWVTIDEAMKLTANKGLQEELRYFEKRYLSS